MRTDLRGRQAILYRRVSSDEQAREGYSLRSQTDALGRLCRDSGIDIVHTVEDDGYSARTFDRPGWKGLLAWLKANRGAADLLLITKWSRFSRNLNEGLAQIERLRALGIEVQAAEQWVNYADPNHLYVLAINLVEPDVANRWLSINVRQGMRRAMLEGRWVSSPPVGYLRVRDASDKASLVPDPVQGPLVAGAFVLAADGALPLDDVYRRSKANGLRVGRSRFFLMLRQPAYAGRIVVPATSDEPEQQVRAAHEPIVDAATWARVQARFEAPRRRGERGPNDAFPLRGILRCPSCGLPQSSSHNTGRSATYRYYWCHRCARSGSAHRHRVEAVHEAFETYLAGVAVPKGVAAVWREVVAETAREGAAESRRRAADVRRQIADEEGRRARAEDLYIDGRLDRVALDRASARVDERLDELGRQLRETEASADVESAAHVRFALDVLEDLPALWGRSDAEGQRVLAGSLWPDGVVFDGSGFAFERPSPVIALFETLRGETDGRRPRSGDRRPVRYTREDSNL